MFLLLERGVIQFIQFFPEILIELFEREIPAFLQIVKDSFFENADRVFYRGFETGLPNLRRKDHRMVMFRPFSVILIQFRLDPVLVRDHGLLAVIAYHDGRYTAKSLKRVVVNLDPLHLLCGFHALSVNVLGIRKDRDKHDDRRDLAGKAVDQVEGLACEVDLHRLCDHRRKVRRFVVLLAPLAEELTELPVLIGLLLFGNAASGVALPAYLERHVLPLIHEIKNLRVIGVLIAFIPSAFTRHFAIHLHGDPSIRDSGREWITQFLALLEGLQKVMNSRLTSSGLFGDLPKG